MKTTCESFISVVRRDKFRILKEIECSTKRLQKGSISTRSSDKDCALQFGKNVEFGIGLPVSPACPERQALLERIGTGRHSNPARTNPVIRD